MKNPMLELLKIKTIKCDLESVMSQVNQLDIPEPDKQRYLSEVDELIQRFHKDLCGLNEIIESNI